MPMDHTNATKEFWEHERHEHAEELAGVDDRHCAPESECEVHEILAHVLKCHCAEDKADAIIHATGWARANEEIKLQEKLIKG